MIGFYHYQGLSMMIDALNAEFALTEQLRFVAGHSE
jgi:hypothetical protein